MSLEVSRFRGVPIKLHFSLIIILVLLSWTLSSGFMPQLYPNLGVLPYWIMGVAGAIILIVSVTLHELAHVFLSLKYGLEVRQIILFVFGGIADIKEETKDYKKEFKIAAAGPIASFSLALIFLFLLYLTLILGGSEAIPSGFMTSRADIEENANLVEQQQQQAGNLNEIVPMISGILLYSTVANALVGIFNLLPAFPLDGGRMLRAGLIKWNKSYDEATKIAVRTGTGISFGLMAYGFITIFTGSTLGGFWFIIIGWFIQTAAQTYLRQHEISNRLSSLYLRDIMITNFIYVNSNLTVRQVINDYFNVYRKSEFPILNNAGSLLGSISNKQINAVAQDNVDEVKVTEIMSRINDLIVMDKNGRADEALKQIYQFNKNRIYVGYQKKSLLDNLVNSPRVMQNKQITRLSFPSISENSKPPQIKLEGIISKTDLLNIARSDDKFKDPLDKDDK